MEEATPQVVILEDRRGDRRRFIVSPRLTLSSTGVDNLLEVTAAPGLNYDDIYATTDLDWDLGLRAEQSIGRSWLITLNDRFFLGDDPVLGEELRTAVIVPETGEVVPEEPTVGVPAESNDDTLTEQFGRRRYWQNDLDLLTRYTYGQDSDVGLGYTYGMLRNDEDDVGGYTEYDRHTGILTLGHRFNGKWRAEGEIRYSRGLFDEPEIVVVTPPEDDTADIPSEDDNDITIDQLSDVGSQDLREYNFRGLVNYEYDPHLLLFTSYRYLRTDYDAALRQDYGVNEIALGLDYDITQRLHVTLSGGPSFGSFENSPTETDYNAYAGLIWDYQQGTFTVYGEKRYDQSNFDGRRSGLTDSWRTGIAFDYQLTQNLALTCSASYEDDDRLQYPIPNTIVIVDTGQPLPDEPPAAELDRPDYNEKFYDAGLTLSYTFLRWYTVSGGYRYYKHDTDLIEDNTGNYDEHRIFVTLSVFQELFRW